MNSMNNKGLGRGLSSLIPAASQKMHSGNPAAVQPLVSHVTKPSPAPQKQPENGLKELLLVDIIPNTLQPRLQFDERTLQELADSIAQYGVLEPVVVTPLSDGRWHLIAGERRFRASKLAGKTSIPAIVRTSTDLERLELALIENIQRQDLNPLEKAQSLAKLVNDFGLTQEQAAKKMGIARSSLANSIRLLDLPEDIQTGLMQGKISEGHAKILLGIENPEAQLELYRQMTSGRAMSVKELSEMATQKGVAKVKKVKTGTQDFEIRMLEEQLQSALGTKVHVEIGKGEHRKIVIDAFSIEEFQRLIKNLL